MNAVEFARKIITAFENGDIDETSELWYTYPDGKEEDFEKAETVCIDESGDILLDYKLNLGFDPAEYDKNVKKSL